MKTDREIISEIYQITVFNPNAKIHWLRKGYKFLNNKGEEMGVFKNALALVYFNASHT